MHRPVRYISRTAFAGVLGLGLAASLAACSASTPAPAPSGEPAEMTGAVDPHAPETTDVTALLWRQTSSVPFYLAQSEGFASDYGITLNAEYVENSPAALSGVIGGTGQIGSMSLWSVVGAIQEGVDLRIIGESFRHVKDSMFMETMPGSGIEKIEDLAGKTVGVAGMNSGLDLSIKNWFLEHDMDPSSINFVNLGYGEIGQALQTGTIDAGSLTGAALAQARSEIGSVDVFDYTDLLDFFPATSYVTTGEFADANPNTIAAFQCAVVVDGSTLAASDDAKYRSAIKTGLGWDDAAIDATPKANYVPSNDPKVQQVVPDLMYVNGLLPEPMDITAYMIPIPDNC